MMNDDKITKELKYIFASHLFENKLQMKRLLSYLLQNVDSLEESAFDQRVIARECLGRGVDFDPVENPVVRIEIGRLRKLLSRFYEEELSRPYKISIPVGQYRPVVSVESLSSKTKYLPELIPSPANPERLSVLLQFTTEGEDSTELYLLRHRIRIGITIALGHQEAVRVLVAIPSEDRKVADSIDFIMRVSLASAKTGFKLSSEVSDAETEEVLFASNKSLAENYEPPEIDDLLSILVSEFFDHEIGVLWRKWVTLRQGYKKVGALKVAALVEYQRYLFDENDNSIKLAFVALKKALESHPGDKIISLVLADIYCRIIINGYEVVNHPIDDGLIHVREALRFSPGSEWLHTSHAFLMLFQQEYDFSVVSLLATDSQLGSNYFTTSFHYHVLKYLAHGQVGGFQAITTLCDKFSYYPKIYPVLAYLSYYIEGDLVQASHWKVAIIEQKTYKTLEQCVKHMKLSGKWSRKSGCRELLESINKDLGLCNVG